MIYKCSRKIKDDEYYTRYEDIKKLFDNQIVYKLKKYNLKVCCPCDTDKSNFYKYFCDYGIKVDLYQDVFKVDYSKYDLVVTNPPFKIKKELLKFYLDNNINFILVLPDIMIYNLKHNKLKMFKNQKPQLFINGRLNKFIRSDGSFKNVGCDWVSNCKIHDILSRSLKYEY